MLQWLIRFILKIWKIWKEKKKSCDFNLESSYIVFKLL